MVWSTAQALFLPNSSRCITIGLQASVGETSQKDFSPVFRSTAAAGEGAYCESRH